MGQNKSDSAHETLQDLSIFPNKFGELRNVAESLLRNFCQDLSSSTLHRAISYSLQSPGKRLRPVLALASAELLGVPERVVSPFALALEILHSSTLVHDDLPALDDDELRRGIPTTHVVHGEAIALLAGDAMVGQAIQLALSVPSTADARAAIAQLIAGTYVRICEGQVLDLQAGEQAGKQAGKKSGEKTGEQARAGEPKSDSELLQALEARHRLKTGALITAAVAGPALLLEDERRRVLFEAFSEFGGELGLLFQITDDILGATSTTAALGKTAGIDEREGRITYVTLLGKEGALKEADRRSTAAIDALEPFGETAWFLRELVSFVRNREH